MDKHQLIHQLALTKHIEGGYFAETYRSPLTHSLAIGERSLLTSIYYLLTDDSPINYLHRNRSDIIHYFHGGSPITYLTISPEGILRRQVLGWDFAAGHQPQILVKGGDWKAGILEQGEFGLLGEAVAPGFDYDDEELATPTQIQSLFPALWPQIAPYVGDRPESP